MSPGSWRYWHASYARPAPAGTPQEIVLRLHKEFSAAISLPKVRQRIAALGGEVVAGGPDRLKAPIAAELAT